MILVGHGDIVAALEKNLPPVCLFLGPHSVGKWTVAEHFRQQLEPSRADVLRVHDLSMDAAREIVRFAQTAPTAGRRVVLAQLDRAKPGALNALLKTLEEPGEVQFFLIAEREVPKTVASRCAIYRFGRLSKEQVVKVLIEKHSMRETEAAKAASASGGQVREAVKSLERSSAKAVTLIAIRALRDRDVQRLESVAKEWDDDCTYLLTEWCSEALTGRLRLFSSEEADLTNIGRRIPLSILTVLSEEIRPGLLVRAALTPLLRGA